MANQQTELWETNAEAELLETRLTGFWNPDYLQQILLPLLDLQPGDRVLDVGTGAGSLVLLLARLLPAVHFVGIDVTPALLEDARAQQAALGLQNVEFRAGDALNLPFADNEFDATVCQTVLMHLSDPARAVQEMSRVLRAGGLFMAAEYRIVTADWPIDGERQVLTDAEGQMLARYAQMLAAGYRNMGQGDMQIGGRVPFLAIDAGLEIVDVRINDRVLHAFPPYQKPMQRAARREAQNWANLIQDPTYRAWLTGALTAGGGSEGDMDDFLNLLLLARQRQAIMSAGEGGYSFVWLTNPVLFITFARKL